MTSLAPDQSPSRDLLAGHLTSLKVDVGQIHPSGLDQRPPPAVPQLDGRAEARLDLVCHGEASEQLHVWWSATDWPPRARLRRILLEGDVRMSSGGR